MLRGFALVRGLTTAIGAHNIPSMVRHENSAFRRLRLLAGAERRVREVSADAASTAELINGLRAPFNDALGLSGMLLSATDPHTTTLGTATVVEHLPGAMSVPWMHNEFLEDDFNKFAELHRTRAPATTLHRATQGRPQLSPRHSLLHRPHGLGPELRTTFSLGDACWGVANLVREVHDEDFDEVTLDWLERLRPVIAAGIRRTTVTATHPGAGVPGVVNLDLTGSVVSMTADAGRMLADLWLCPFVEEHDYRLPGEAYMIATLTRARAEGRRRTPPPVTRLHGRSGRWLTIRGDCTLTADGEPSGIALVIEPSRPAEILPLMISAYGLTAREREVLIELSAGPTTGEIATRLLISEHTVRDHIKAILAKTGTKSRGELMSLLFDHHAHSAPTADRPSRKGLHGTPDGTQA